MATNNKLTNQFIHKQIQQEAEIKVIELLLDEMLGVTQAMILGNYNVIYSIREILYIIVKMGACSSQVKPHIPQHQHPVEESKRPQEPINVSEAESQAVNIKIPWAFITQISHLRGTHQQDLGNGQLEIEQPDLHCRSENKAVYFKKIVEDPLLDGSPSQFKWCCECEYEDKSGVLCSHIVKVLLFLGQDFTANMNSRWYIKPGRITKRLLDYRHMANFLKVRSNYKVNLRRGAKSGKKRLKNLSTIQGEEDDNINLSSKDLQEIIDQLEQQKHPADESGSTGLSINTDSTMKREPQYAYSSSSSDCDSSSSII